MGNRRGGNILMALGVVLALIGGGVAFVMTQTGIGSAQRVEVPKKDVVLAKVDLPAGAIVTTDKLEMVKWPEDIIPPGAVTNLADLQGKFTRVPVAARTPLNIGQLAGRDLEKLQTQPAGGQLSAQSPSVVGQEFLLEKGQVLVAVEYASAGALIRAGAVRPGSRVDIIVRTPGATSDQIAPIFRNLEIRAIGSVDPDKAAPEGSAILIFAVTPQQALELKFLETMNPDLMLRAAGDGENTQTDLVTQEYMIRKYNLQRPTNPNGGAALTSPPPGAGGR